MMRILVLTALTFLFAFHTQAASFGAQEDVASRVEQLLKLPNGFLAKNYNVSFPVDAGNRAPVIVHIGQVHEDFRGAAYSQKIRGQILYNQTKIQDLILAIQKNNTVPCVFSEGFAEKSPDALLSVRKRRDALIQAVNLRAKQSRVFYARDLDVFQAFIDRIKTFRQYNDAEINVKVYQTIVEYLEQRNMNDDDARKVKAARARLNELEQKYGKYPSVLMSGAVNKLFFEKKIAAVCPAEDLNTNKKAQAVMNDVNQKLSQGVSLGALNAQKEVVLYERDWAVQKLIRAAPEKYRGDIVIAVFGDAHDWTDATMVGNEQKGARKYSYIKITPKAGTTW